MKRIALFLAVGSLHAASYYVSSTGNDSTGTGSSIAPWLTLGRAVGAVVSGDTIIIVADGNKVTCDATLPATVTNITVQSSKLALFNPPGYRVSPAIDGPNFGKCQFAGTGIVAAGEVHGSNQGNTYQTTTRSGSTFTITGAGWVENGFAVANGTQVEFELYNEFGNPIMPSSAAVPSPLVTLTHYYIVNCAPSGPACGHNGSTFQVAATSGGSPITITACDSDCQTYTAIGLPVQADASADTITSTDALSGTYVNGTPITFASGGLRFAAALPAPLQQDTIYYVRDISGRAFKVAATLGGAAIDITDVGTGMQSLSNANVPHGWKFSGIEFAPTTGNFMSNALVIGGGKETSPFSMPSNFEFDRVWIHDYSQAENGPNRGIAENSRFFYMHDSWCDGIKSTGEAQCIAGWSSYGPTAIINNFLEGTGENILYGGALPTYYPITNQNKTITGNYFYKPYIFKWVSGAFGTPSGSCLSDAPNSPDPDHRGGEYLFDTVGMQGWICVGGTWTITGTTPTHYGVKNLLEYKNGRNWTVTGNLLQGNWVDAQAGNALAFGQRTDSGPGDASDHVTFVNNKITNAYRFISWGSICTGTNTGNLPCVNGVTNNHVIQNNLTVLGGPSYCGVAFNSAGCGFNMWAHVWSGRAALQDTWNHNTVIQPDGDNFSPYTPLNFLYDTRITSTLHDQMLYTNSIDSYDFFGLESYFSTNWSNSTWNRMALIGAAGPYTGSAGPGNTFTNTSLPANIAAVGFVNASAGDYHLASTSPYSAANASAMLLSTDGTDLGADIDLVNMATSGAGTGTPPWDQQAGLQLTPGSTQVVFRYKAPTSTACTATIYNVLARIAANQVASVADSAASSISDILTRQLYISGLTASTHYWYKLVCAGSVIMVGDFFTRAAGTGTYTFSFDWSTATAMRYSSSASMSSPTSLGAATHQAIPVATNSVIYAQVGTAGPITILIAP